MISVIIPVYNGEKWIARCLDSLLNQTVAGQTELIAVDDGSSDGSGKILDAYAARYPSVRVLHGENQGVSAARNRGIELARGDYLTFVDGDDFVEPEHLEALLRGISAGADISGTGFLADYSDKTVRRCSSQVRTLDRKQAITAFLNGSDMDPNVTDKLFSRKTVGDVRFDSRFALAEDQYFLFQCLKRTDCVILYPECSYHYIMNDSSACRSGFSRKKLGPVQVSGLIAEEVRQNFPELTDLAESAQVDVACRTYAEIYAGHAAEEYEEEYRELRKRIHRYSILKKFRFSSKKHFLAFAAAWIHPGFYNFLKNDMKLQYRR